MAYFIAAYITKWRFSVLTKNGGGDHKQRLSRMHYICTMHCVQRTLEKQCTANHVIMTVIVSLMLFEKITITCLCSLSTYNIPNSNHFFNCVYQIYCMMTSSNGNTFRVTALCAGNFTGHRWIPLTKASDAELVCFLWSASEQTFE